MSDTIAAVATPNSAGGIAVIRISGPEAVKTADRVFKAASGRRLDELKGYRAAFGAVYDKDEKIDDAIALVFRAPHSYTGEDVVEISCHGGIYITRKILRLILDAGASMAAGGEFSKRAFLNGKMSLTQAEAVMDVINAKSRSAARAAQNALGGALAEKLRKIKDKLTYLLSLMGAWADYPEEMEDEEEIRNISAAVSECAESLRSLTESYDTGRLITNGIRTAIVGRPNVGKSTLMNLLSGCERSIVTDIAGTTRDVVEETVMLGDYCLRLADTAGIRKTDDIVENAGVSIAKKRLEESDLVIAVFDATSRLSPEDEEILAKLSERPAVAVINKSDLSINIDIESVKKRIENTVVMSAASGDYQQLSLAVGKAVHAERLDGADAVLQNERQLSCAKSALHSLDEAKKALSLGIDASAVLVQDALSSVCELSGEDVSEKVVDKIFSSFCVGK